MIFRVLGVWILVASGLLDQAQALRCERCRREQPMFTSPRSRSEPHLNDLLQDEAKTHEEKRAVDVIEDQTAVERQKRIRQRPGHA